MQTKIKQTWSENHIEYDNKNKLNRKKCYLKKVKTKNTFKN